MSIFHAVVLGLIQGLTEFLPVSSSAHLALTPWFFGWLDPGLTFDVALHSGTLLAVVAFFWKDWLKLFRGGLTKGLATADGRLFWLLAVASVPGALAGALFEKQAETIFRGPLLIAALLAVMGVVLYVADRMAAGRTASAPPTFLRGLAVGLAQAAAIIPGVSRSGATMSAGMFAGMSRPEAARFSFLLSTPMIFGAVVFKLRHFSLSALDAPFLVGIAVSAVVGFLAIGGLMKWLTRRGFLPFAVYRLLLAAAVVLVFVLR
ncbi:MAG: undecaprenyl-diphosphate phosphatase [Acidobacteriota bacterium]|nr:undecaprenyl-diphosphate phosphatase [Acidobacteriota bacterium]